MMHLWYMYFIRAMKSTIILERLTRFIYFFYTSKLLSVQCLSALNLASMKTGFEGGKIRIYENPENI